METKQVWTKRIIYIGFIIMLVWKISVSCEKQNDETIKWIRINDEKFDAAYKSILIQLLNSRQKKWYGSCNWQRRNLIVWHYSNY